MADPPQMNPITFLLNRDTTEMVKAPAFSITKVLATLATVATPLAALLVAKIGSIDFSSGEIVSLAVAVLGFLGIVSSADVFARAVAVRSTAGGGGAVPIGEDRGDAVLVEFSPVREGVLAAEGPDPKIHVLAARGAELLVHESGKQLAWVPQDRVTFSG